MFYRSRTLSLRIRSLSGRLTALLRSRLAWIGALAHDRRGISAVEFGLAAPVFLAALSPVIDLGMAFSQLIKLRQAAGSGAQYASMNPWSDSSVTYIKDAVNGSTDLTLTWASNPTEYCGCPN